MLLIEILLFSYCLYFVSYSFIFAVAGHFYKRSPLKSQKNSSNKYLILTPGYKEDSVIVNAVKANLEMDFPKDRYELAVIADSFSEETLNQLKELPIQVLEVSFEKSTKVKSLKEAVKTLDQDFDYTIVLDADNVVAKDYLTRIDQYLEKYHNTGALQTRRMPKNKNNEMALLDGISEDINNHIYRQGTTALGFSASLNGSGMVFRSQLFKDTILQMDSVGGFDRELEYRLLEEGVRVKYLKEAQVFDEKTDNHSNFKNQRKRWISSQYVYLARYFGKGIRALTRGNLVYFNSTVWRNIQLPRLINLGLITIFTILALILNNYLNIDRIYWVLLWSINAFAFAISIPRKFYNMELLRSTLLLPKIFFTMFTMLFKLKGANKRFIHTPHKGV